MIYLASPYTHPDPRVREARYDAACRATVEFVRAGHAVFSPIVYSHPLVKYGLPTDWSFWMSFDLDHLRRCEELVVLTIDGWQESQGVQAELDLARTLTLPIRYLIPESN